jgi:hypothetical protein
VFLFHFESWFENVNVIPSHLMKPWAQEIKFTNFSETVVLFSVTRLNFIEFSSKLHNYERKSANQKIHKYGLDKLKPGRITGDAFMMQNQNFKEF